MILCVDIGNTHIHLGLFIRNALRKTWKIASMPQRTCDEYALLLRGLIGEGMPLRAAIIASVVPRLEWPFAQAVEQEFKVMPLIMNERTPTGLINGYEHPDEVGMDRLANAAGANYFHGAPALILDFGTAITLDYLAPAPLGEALPVYAGGAIMPGIEMAAEALARNTARLPRIALTEPNRAIGRTTAESIQSGLLHGYTGAITTLVERAKEELNDNVTVIATGGDALGLKDHLPCINFVYPDLTLYGLRQIIGRSIGDPLPPKHDEETA